MMVEKYPITFVENKDGKLEILTGPLTQEIKDKTILSLEEMLTIDEIEHYWKMDLKQLKGEIRLKLQKK